MEVKIFKPKNEILKKLIDCFYILSRTKDEAPCSYITFPSLFTVVSFAPETSFIWKPEICIGKSEKVVVIKDIPKKLGSVLVSRFKNPICVEYTCDIIEITIAFKPLGINALLDKNLNEYADGPNFFPFKDLAQSMLEIFDIKDNQKKINLLEEYLVSKVNGFKHSFLFELIQDLMDESQANVSLIDLAKKYKISYKNLVKHFERHTCKTPNQFRKIARFRATLEKHIENPRQVSLTELAYKFNYFDQSHFVKDFKALTGYSPKAFFKNLTSLEDGKVNWTFL
jgi:AraC-like DNA-binding protein